LSRRRTRRRLVTAATTDCRRVTMLKASNLSWLRRSARALYVIAERAAHRTAILTGPP
jgi:hypothetical protein